MYDLVTIGDIKLDVFIDLGREAKVSCELNRKDCLLSLEYGKKIPVHSALTMAAGSAMNVALGTRRLGASSGIVSVMGNDSAHALAVATLKAEGIDTTHITAEKGESSFSAILNFEGESTMLSAHRPYSYTLPKSLKTKWLFVSEMGPNHRSLFRQILAFTKKNKTQLAFNPGTVQLERIDLAFLDFVERVNLLLVNKDEAKKIAGVKTDNISALLSTLRALGPETVVITDGPKGVYACYKNQNYFAPAFPAMLVEATGAGDAFSAGFITAMIKDKGIESALACGTANAASVISKIGPQAGLLSQTELARRLKNAPEYGVRKL
ncbi:MAG: carbohydrate kinase family protein [Patescibacteria group bacterium]